MWLFILLDCDMKNNNNLKISAWSQIAGSRDLT